MYIGSFYGDSQLVKLNSEKDENNSFITLLENYTNLGPIVDFVVVDLDRQGQVWLLSLLPLSLFRTFLRLSPLFWKH